MNLANFRLEIGEAGVALLTWDMPDRSMNVITAQVMRELGEVIDKVASDSAIKGCVIVSGKESFSGGADLGIQPFEVRPFAAGSDAYGRKLVLVPDHLGIQARDIRPQRRLQRTNLDFHPRRLLFYVPYEQYLLHHHSHLLCERCAAHRPRLHHRGG